MWIYVWWTWCNLQAGKSATSASEISVLHGTTQHDTIYVYDNKGMRWHADGRLTWSVVIERQCPLNVQPISIPVAIGCNKTCQNMILIYFIFRFGTPNPKYYILSGLHSASSPCCWHSRRQSEQAQFFHFPIDGLSWMALCLFFFPLLTDERRRNWRQYFVFNFCCCSHTLPKSHDK